MQQAKVEAAIAEAHHFLKAAKAAVVRLQADKYAHMGSKETATCKRASMDLTRALAELRKR